ncbi:MAG: polymerase, sigma-24 subunit, subfamily [Ilumatobacteraceae bacterium]|nr:polymerase, sigma-24 subunit, subfamily [Ilumatobacteraceae bacterium]
MTAWTSADASIDAPGDAAALFRTHRMPMARLAYVLTGQAAVADEIVQDAFLKVHQHWARLDNPIGYLRVAVVNGCHSFHRRRALEQRNAVAAVSAVEDAVSDGLGDIGTALTRLPERQRTALALRYLCDLSDRDIADALGARPATIRSLISRGLAALREEIQQ